jgi:lipid A 3-O-deacylase
MSLGVIGSYAGGRLVQNGFHSVINAAPSHGWSAELHNEPAVEFGATRIWRKRLATLGPVESDILPAATVGIGTVRDYAEIGGRFRIGHGLDRDFGPSRLTDGPNGEDAYLRGDDLGYYAFVGMSAQAIARDAFLDGDLTGRSAHVSRRPLMADIEGGVALLWRGTRISYTHTWQTDAFRGQKAGLFNFGSIAMSTRF